MYGTSELCVTSCFSIVAEALWETFEPGPQKWVATQLPVLMESNSCWKICDDIPKQDQAFTRETWIFQINDFPPSKGWGTAVS